jgi:hypothetical protein
MKTNELNSKAILMLETRIKKMKESIQQDTEALNMDFVNNLPVHAANLWMNHQRLKVFSNWVDVLTRGDMTSNEFFSDELKRLERFCSNPRNLRMHTSNPMQQEVMSWQFVTFLELIEEIKLLIH